MLPQSDDFCPVVNGVPYDDTINDFDYEAGYHYVLEANRYDDGRYVLTSVVSKTRAEGTEEVEITIDWGRVECGDGHPGFCKVYSGVPYRGEIVGFQPEARIQLPPARREIQHVSRRHDRITRQHDRITSGSGLRLSLAGDA